MGSAPNQNTPTIPSGLLGAFVLALQAVLGALVSLGAIHLSGEQLGSIVTAASLVGAFVVLALATIRNSQRNNNVTPGLHPVDGGKKGAG